MTWVIPEIPKSNNAYIGRTNRWEYQKDKKYWAELIFYCCTPRKKFDKATVLLTYHFADFRRRDPDNYSGKMILDGLVSAGILIDDDFGHIKLSTDAVFGAEKKGTEITIEERI